MILSVKQKLFLSIGILSLIGMVFLVLYGNSGFYDLNRFEAKGAVLAGENNRLEDENRQLLRQVNRLKTDPEFVDDMARKDLGLVAEDEIVFRFSEDSE